MTPQPEDFPPLRDRVAGDADAADLMRSMLDLDDICGGSLLLLLCDDEQRPTVPVLISDVPLTASPGQVIDRWFAHVGEVLSGTGSGVIFARGRPGQSFVLDHDRAWHDAVVQGCTQAGMALVAAFVVTPHAVIPFAQPTLGECAS